MAEGGKDTETTDDIFKNIYSLGEKYTNTETTFTNPMFDDNTQYNSSDNSSLSSNVNFDDIEDGSAFLRYEITKMDTGEDVTVKYEERVKVLRNPRFVENTKWKFTQTNLKLLAALVFTAEEVTDEQIDELHPNIKPGNYLLSGPNETTLYMIGENRSGDNTWVRITDKNGKLLKRSTIEGFEGGKRVAEKLSSLSHHYQATGKYAELKQRQENEAAIAEERRRKDTGFFHNLGSKDQTGEPIQLQIRKPTPQKTNTVSYIEDVINSDNETSFIENIVDSPKPIDRLIDATEDELKSLGLTDHVIGELRGLNQAGDNLAAIRRDKDMIIKELEKRIADKDEEILNTASNNFVEKTSRD